MLLHLDYAYILYGLVQKKINHMDGVMLLPLETPLLSGIPQLHKPLGTDPPNTWYGASDMLSLDSQPFKKE